MAKIKELISQEEEVLDYLDLVRKRASLKLKNKKAKKFLKRFCKLEPVKRKKLLKGAKVLINIEFKEKDE